MRRVGLAEIEDIDFFRLSRPVAERQHLAERRPFMRLQERDVGRRTIGFVGHWMQPVIACQPVAVPAERTVRRAIGSIIGDQQRRQRSQCSSQAVRASVAAASASAIAASNQIFMSTPAPPAKAAPTATATMPHRSRKTRRICRRAEENKNAPRPNSGDIRPDDRSAADCRQAHRRNKGVANSAARPDRHRRSRREDKSPIRRTQRRLIAKQMALRRS